MARDSFTLTFGGRPIVDPRRAAQTSVDHGFPDSHFYGKVTRYVCPVGSQPGTGKLLMRKADLDAVRLLSTCTLDLTYRDNGRAVKTSLGGMVVTSASAAFTGRDGDGQAVYLVSFADDRWTRRRKPWAAAYNMRERVGTSYVAATTNGGTAWTWQELVQELWTGAIGGTAPTLPYTPHGTPEGFDFYKCDSVLDALASVLTRIDCSLVHDPRSVSYTIRRSEDSLAKLLALDSRVRFSPWNDRSEHWPAADWPATIRVRFRRRPIPTDESDPFYTVDVTPTPAPANVTSGTILVLDDDLFATGAGTPSNAATCSARASERMTEWVRRYNSLDRRALRSYKGFVSEAFDLLGEAVAAVLVSDRGGDEGAGLTTELYNAADAKVAAWTWNDSLPPGGAGTGEAGGSTRAVVDRVTCDALGNIVSRYTLAYGPALPTPPTGSNVIEGTVTVDAVAASGREIVATYDGYEWRGTTDGSGDYTISDLPGGTYVVLVIPEAGEAGTIHQTVTVPTSPATADFTLTT